MNYSKYIPFDVINGIGSRTTLFLSGCEHMCKGCYNQSTWSPKSGHLFDTAMEDQIIKDLNDTRIFKDGLSLSGGDPLHPANLEGVLHLVKRVYESCNNKNIWLWTGYKLSELNYKQRQILEYIDVLVDGKYVQELYDANLKFRGSSNQKIHILNKTLKLKYDNANIDLSS